MNAMAWQQRIEAARTEQEVLEVTREFLATFTPRELATLPRACDPPLKLVDRDDISGYAFDLVRHRCKLVEENELVHRLSGFFTNASIRLTHIASRRFIERGQIVLRDGKWPA